MRMQYICEMCDKMYDDLKVAEICEVRCKLCFDMTNELARIRDFDMKENPLCYATTSLLTVIIDDHDDKQVKLR